jgi:hypothetical protein
MENEKLVLGEFTFRHFDIIDIEILIGCPSGDPIGSLIYEYKP